MEIAFWKLELNYVKQKAKVLERAATQYKDVPDAVAVFDLCVVGIEEHSDNIRSEARHNHRKADEREGSIEFMQSGDNRSAHQYVNHVRVFTSCFADDEFLHNAYNCQHPNERADRKTFGASQS
ncbi:hypothetical protein D3C72_785000 [compost metagenome]